VTRSPVVWGGLATLGFYALVQNGPLSSPLVDRYFASHPVEYLAMTLFFVGLASLAVKFIGVMEQAATVDRVTLGPAPQGGQRIDAVDGLLQSLVEAHAQQANGYLVRRLREALEYVRRKGSADTLDEHLRYASDIDAGRMHSSYSLVRIIVWAIPILGFLGTVVGITLAIAKLAPEELQSSLPQVVLGLQVAFDTTALALALSMILMFAQFAVDRFETRLLAKVDDKVTAELVGRFQEFGTASDPNVATVRQMADAVVRGCEQLVHRQAELWQKTIAEAQSRWNQASGSAGKQLEVALAAALKTSLQEHAAKLAETDHAAAEENRRQMEQNRKHLQQSYEALLKTTGTLAKQQSELARQSEVLTQTVNATDQIKKLETGLNDNLAALSGARHFEETVVSLSAAIQLLSAQLNGARGDAQRVQLESGPSKSQAA